MTYDSTADMQAGLASEDGRAVVGDLANLATGGPTLLLTDE